MQLNNFGGNYKHGLDHFISEGYIQPQTIHFKHEFYVGGVGEVEIGVEVGVLKPQSNHSFNRQSSQFPFNAFPNHNLTFPHKLIIINKHDARDWNTMCQHRYIYYRLGE